MQFAEFIALHLPALDKDEVRNNLILGLLGRAARTENPQLTTWTLGGAGACAIRMPGRSIILGDLAREHCRALAEAARDLDYPGVAGLDPAPRWFVERAVELGHAFREPMPQRIYALSRPPTYPGAPGSPRPVTADDAALFADWMTAFVQEATPRDPVASRAELEKTAGDGRHWFWVVDGAPVSMAGVVRRLRSAGAISAVYTPPAHRGRGFAGSATAVVAERLFAEGKSTVCLYADRRNAASNRCYVKIGFEPVCDAATWMRR